MWRACTHICIWLCVLMSGEKKSFPESTFSIKLGWLINIAHFSGVFVLGIPLSFYSLSGVKWIWMWSQLQFYSGVYVALVMLLAYPLSGTCTAEHSLSGMKRLQTPLRRTMTDKRLSSLAISAHTQAPGLSWYWWPHYSRVCPSEGYTSRPLLVTSFVASLFYPFLL